MHKQQGSLLIEVTIALFLFTLIAVSGVSYLQKRAAELQVSELATWMLGVQKGVQRYLDAHNELLTTEGVSLTVTVAQLKADGFLSSAYPEKDRVVIRLLQENSCLEAACHVHGIIYTRHPLLNKKGVFNVEEVAHWRQRTKGEGLIVSPQHSDWLSGGQLHLANTAHNFGQALPVGTVALLASTSPEAIAYAQLDPEANPYFQTDLDALGSIHTDQDLSAGRYLLLPHTESVNTVCNPIGAVTRSDDKKGLLVCEEGKWIRAAAEEGSAGLDPELAVVDPLIVKRLFELLWGKSLPLHVGGYFLSIENIQNRRSCVGRNPLTGSCDCKTGVKSQLVEFRPVDIRYTNQVSVPRTLYLYGC